MARRKLKPPTSRRRSGRGGRQINFGWWGTISAIVILGVLGVILSRGQGSATEIVREITAPDIGDAQAISVVQAMAEPYDRLEEGDPVYEVQAGEETRTVEAPADGVLVELRAQPGEELEPGTVLATMQTGPDFNAANAAGNHWHTAYGINVCGTWLGALGQWESDFHTHGDGIMHAHPRSNAAAGRNATAGLFFERAGGDLTPSRIEYAGETYRSGEVECGEGENAQDAVMRWAVNGEEQDGNPANFVVGNGDVFVVAFIPEGDEMPTEPPSVAYMAENYATPNLPGYEAAPPAEGAEGEGAEGQGAGEGTGDGATTTAPVETTTTGG